MDVKWSREFGKMVKFEQLIISSSFFGMLFVKINKYYLSQSSLQTIIGVVS